jgi:ketol-acid reductoisomerase
MARVWDAGELDPAPILDRRVAVIGYGNQGRAQGLNLHRRGVRITVGNRPDAYADRARADGLPVRSIGEAAGGAEVVLFLVPDEVQPEVYASELAPALGRGQTLCFASGYNVAFGLVRPAAELDVVMVAPRMIGRGVMDLPRQGRGFPVLVGVERDASGAALATALALAAGIGAGHPGGCVVESSFREEATIDLFSEHTWAPATVFLLKACCDLLIASGVSPEAAILETYASGEIGEIGRAMAELGLAGQMRLHSHTSQYGHLLWGEEWVGPEVSRRLARALEAIRDGTFARRWSEEQRAGLPDFEARWRRLLEASLFDHEDALYRRLGRPSSRRAGNGGSEVR